MKMRELIPENGRKSFGGKAVVVTNDDGSETLFSYQTAIIRRETDGTLTRLCDKDIISTTTASHLKSFCGLTKKEF